MARRRKRQSADTNNHERWMVSYADFITLLMAFFVVMYSISSVNEGKYKTLSESLGEAFSNNGQHGSEVDPIQIGTMPTAIQPIPLANPATAADVEKRRELSDEILKERKQLSQVSGQFEQVLTPFIDDKLVAVKRNDYWIELEMNSEMLFLSGVRNYPKKRCRYWKRLPK
jgi:chemotaxis protein MotB